jgi:hypothetical protein
MRPNQRNVLSFAPPPDVTDRGWAIHKRIATLSPEQRTLLRNWCLDDAPDLEFFAADRGISAEAMRRRFYNIRKKLRLINNTALALFLGRFEGREWPREEVQCTPEIVSHRTTRSTTSGSK